MSAGPPHPRIPLTVILLPTLLPVGLQVGADGVLAIETSNSLETTVDVQEGMEIDRGYISPQFVNNSERLLVEYENALVLITDMKIENVKDIIPLLEQVGWWARRGGCAGWLPLEGWTRGGECRGHHPAARAGIVGWWGAG